MTLEEAIEHAKEVAIDRTETANNTPTEYSDYINSCRECAAEHEQLAEWLTELKKVRDICEHWNDNSCSFVSACNAFEDILHIFKMGVGDKE